YHTSWTFIPDKGEAYSPVSTHENAIDYVLLSTGKMVAAMSNKSSGCTVTDTMVINVLDTLGIVVTHTARVLPKYSCPGERDTFSFSYMQNENHPVTLAWYKNGKLLRRSTNANDTVLITNDFVDLDTIYAVVSLPFECGLERAKDTAVFPLRRHVKPTGSMVVSDDTICVGDTLGIAVKVVDNPDDTVVYSYRWYVNNKPVALTDTPSIRLEDYVSNGTFYYNVFCYVRREMNCGFDSVKSADTTILVMPVDTISVRIDPSPVTACVYPDGRVFMHADLAVEGRHPVFDLALPAIEWYLDDTVVAGNNGTAFDHLVATMDTGAAHTLAVKAVSVAVNTVFDTVSLNFFAVHADAGPDTSIESNKNVTL
ncbi:MAG: hypothetical protein K2I83_01040, partial [Bacteroidales bacterium]|nr:hypothetical protein [Bacteroidales bacterium]